MATNNHYSMRGQYVYFPTITAAMDYMIQRARETRDCGYRVPGSARAGWYEIGEHESITMDYAAIDSFINYLAVEGINTDSWDIETLVQYLNDCAM